MNGFNLQDYYELIKRSTGLRDTSASSGLPGFFFFFGFYCLKIFASNRLKKVGGRGDIFLSFSTSFLYREHELFMWLFV